MFLLCRNTSKVVELDASHTTFSEGNPAEISALSSQEPMATDEIRGHERVQTPPMSSRLMLSSVVIDSHDYEDENGDPCSAV